MLRVKKEKRSNYLKKVTTVLLAVMIFTTVMPIDQAEAKLTSVKQGKEVTSFSSTDTLQYEYVKAKVVGKKTTKIKLEVRTELESYAFKVLLVKAKTDTKDAEYLDFDIYPQLVQYTKEDGVSTYYGFDYTLNFKELNIKNGRYYVLITRAKTPEDAENKVFSTTYPLYKDLEVKVKKYIPRILKYTDVMANNQSYWAIGDNTPVDKYLDPTLEDIRFVLRRPGTDIYDTIDSYKQSFIQRTSDEICQGLTTDMEKAKAIYDYVADNFYYDTVAGNEHALQYCNPYNNLYNLKNKGYSENSRSGIVYTTCQGYSAMYLCLCRAQGIPTRFVQGRKLSSPTRTWQNEGDIGTRDHWWAESYIDGKWQLIDVTHASANRYNKTTGEAVYRGIKSYTLFCPSKEQIGTCMTIINFQADYRNGRYMYDTYEVSAVRTFFDNERNGYKLNSEYNPFKILTWGDGVYSHFHGNGNGKLTHILWANCGLTGSAVFSNFTNLQSFKVYGNELDYIDLSNDTSLQTAYLYDNVITDINLTNCRSILKVKAKNNPLKHLTIYLNGANRDFTCLDHGTFSFEKTTQGKITIYTKADLGYKVDGLYRTDTNTKTYSKSTFTIKPGYTNYELKFKLNPDSYKYDLTYGTTYYSTSPEVPYIQALAKRMNDLGYYTSSSYSYYYGYEKVGEETAYSQKLSEAVKKFQVVNYLDNTGNVDEATWSSIFNDAAVSYTSDSDYQIALTNYEIWKAEQERLEQEAAIVVDTDDLFYSELLNY